MLTKESPDAIVAPTDGAVRNAEPLLTLVAELSYNGAAYSGFAKQKDPAIHTVQGELEQALSTFFRRKVSLVCAGRTDAGVHARGQVVSFPVSREEVEGRKESRLLISLNALTPDDISIKRVGAASPDFSARFDAEWREYRYRIVTGPVPPLFLREFAWWHHGSLDVEAMQEAAKVLIGEHDFKSFCKAASAEGKSTTRFVKSVDLFEEEQLGEHCIVVRVVGNAFLHSMVRTLVGTLVQVGASRREPAWVGKVLDARNRSAAGECAPACGLTFWHVSYPPDAIHALDMEVCPSATIV